MNSINSAHFHATYLFGNKGHGEGEVCVTEQMQGKNK
jgi:hypothetical protein